MLYEVKDDSGYVILRIHICNDHVTVTVEGLTHEIPRANFHLHKAGDYEQEDTETFELPF